MHSLIYWFGFVGAWLLFSGPVYQASVELRAESEATARFEEAMHGVPSPPKVSSWWWLLPPVRLLLSSRRRDDARRAYLASLSAEDLELITRYINVARGWMLVGLGAWLIALKERVTDGGLPGHSLTHRTSSSTTVVVGTRPTPRATAADAA